MDVFTEYMVKKQNTAKDIVLKLLCVLGAVVLLAVALFAIPLAAQLGQIGQLITMIAPLIGVGGVFGAWYLITSMNVEYEYILTNGEMDVDKIIARRRRKRMLTVNARKFEAFGNYRAQDHAGKDYASRVYACTSPDDPGNYYAVLTHATLGKTLLVFTPNDRVLEGLRSYIPRQAGGSAVYGNRPHQD